MQIKMTLRFDYDGEEWTKDVVTEQPRRGELIRDQGLLWMVNQITHFTERDTLMLVIVTEVSLDTKRNVHWQLGHERGWNLSE